MKKPILIAALAGFAAVSAVYWMATPPTAQQAGLVSARGLHWHPRLEIYIDGARQELPGNIGIGPDFAGLPTFDSGMQMTAMHTHDNDGIIHMELPGVVRPDDVKLGNFFRTWGKNFDDLGSKLVAKVNGEPLEDPANYEMQDGDRIVLSFFP